jgi:N-acetylmuramoyl-L-alanine amidase
MDPVEIAYQNARKKYHEIKNNSDQQTQRKAWIDVLKLFKKIAEGHPQHAKGIDAQFTMGRIYMEAYSYTGKKSDLEDAVAQFRKFHERYPQNRLSDDALYLESVIQWKNFGKAEPARANLERIIEKYRDGDQVGEAEALLASLPSPESIALYTLSTDAIQIIYHDPEKMEVKIPVGGHVVTREHNLKDRLFYDLEGVSLSGSTKAISVNHKTIKQIRLGQFTPNTARVVFDLKKLKEHSKKKVKEENGQEYLVFHLNASRVNHEKIFKNKSTPEFKIIAIDPGHGGDDPGAIGPRGTQEKDIALQISRRLKIQMEKHQGVKVFLTRDEDVFIPLEERTQIANEKKADLFLSIHCNANAKPDLRGIQTFFLDTMKDTYDRKLAARENAVSLEKVSDLEMILLDLANRENHEHSSRLAGLVQNRMVKHMSSRYKRVNDLGVRTAVFLVLFHAEMPSVLIETSFISNRDEEQRLKKKDYQEELARSISQGVKAYIDQGEKVVGTL